MGSEVTTMPAGRAMTRSNVEERVEVLHGRLEAHPTHPTRYCVPQDKAATTVERHALCELRSRLDLELAPWSNRTHVDVVISRMLLGFELGKGSSQANIVLLVAEYIEAVKGQPFVAIQQAAARFRSAETLTKWKPGFRPNTAEFAAEVREGMIPLRTKAIHVSRVLDAEVYVPPTDEQRAKVDAATKAYAKDRGAFDREHASPNLTPADVQAAREAVIRDGVDKLKVIGRDPSMSRLMANLDAKRALGSVE